MIFLMKNENRIELLNAHNWRLYKKDKVSKKLHSTDKSTDEIKTRKTIDTYIC